MHSQQQSNLIQSLDAKLNNIFQIFTPKDCISSDFEEQDQN